MDQKPKVTLKKRFFTHEMGVSRVFGPENTLFFTFSYDLEKISVFPLFYPKNLKIFQNLNNPVRPGGQKFE